MPIPARDGRIPSGADFLPVTISASGTPEFSTAAAGQISALGLRFTKPSYAFTSTSPIMKQ